MKNQRARQKLDYDAIRVQSVICPEVVFTFDSLLSQLGGPYARFRVRKALIALQSNGAIGLAFDGREIARITSKDTGPYRVRQADACVYLMVLASLEAKEAEINV